MNSRTLLINNQAALINLKAGLTFATDQEAQQAILNRFALANMIWNDPAIEALRLQHRADQIAPVINELYKTTLYEYNPIHNYDRIEEYTDEEKTSGAATSNSTNNQSSSGTDTASQYPMANAGVKRKVSENESSSSDRATVNGSSTEQGDRVLTHKAHLSGNIGVMSTQDMIRQQREILINVLDEFARRFSDLFYYEM